MTSIQQLEAISPSHLQKGTLISQNFVNNECKANDSREFGLAVRTWLFTFDDKMNLMSSELL